MKVFLFLRCVIHNLVFADYVIMPGERQGMCLNRSNPGWKLGAFFLPALAGTIERRTITRPSLFKKQVWPCDSVMWLGDQSLSS